MTCAIVAVPVIAIELRRTTVSEVFTQFALKMKRNKENDPTELIITDPAFSESLIDTMERIKDGKVSWKSYDEVFFRHTQGNSQSYSMAFFFKASSCFNRSAR